MPLHEVNPLEQDERDGEAAKARDAQRRQRQAEVDYVQGLRDLADFLDRRPDLIGATTAGVTVYWWANLDQGDDVEAAFVEKAKSLGDARTDVVSGSYFNSELRFGPHKVQVTRPINLDRPAGAKPPHPLEQHSVKAPDDV